MHGYIDSMVVSIKLRYRYVYPHTTTYTDLVYTILDDTCHHLCINYSICMCSHHSGHGSIHSRCIEPVHEGDMHLITLQ